MGPGLVEVPFYRACVVRPVALFITEGASTEKAVAGSAGVCLPWLPLSAYHVLGVLGPVPWVSPPPPRNTREDLCMHFSAERL